MPWHLPGGRPSSPSPVVDGSIPRIILSSGSPRRLDLLRRVGIEPEVAPTDIDETPIPGETPDALVTRLAGAKAEATEHGEDTVVIAADTVVVLDEEILGKPVDSEDAKAMLRALSGRTHQVLTGVYVARGARRAHTVERTAVTLRQLSEPEIDAYVATDEPADKAGAYAIQGIAAVFVTGIEGSDTNVIGLPLAATCRLLSTVGLDVWSIRSS